MNLLDQVREGDEYQALSDDQKQLVDVCADFVDTTLNTLDSQGDTMVKLHEQNVKTMTFINSNLGKIIQIEKKIKQLQRTMDLINIKQEYPS